MTNTEKINFNINHNVWVRLTDKGRLIARKDSDWRPEEKDGWSKWQLWDLINTFGDFCYLGAAKLPFETEILIELPQKVKTPKERGLELIKRIQGSQEAWNLDELDLLTELIQSIPTIPSPNRLVKEN